MDSEPSSNLIVCTSLLLPSILYVVYNEQPLTVLLSVITNQRSIKLNRSIIELTFEAFPSRRGSSNSFPSSNSMLCFTFPTSMLIDICVKNPRILILILMCKTVNLKLLLRQTLLPVFLYSTVGLLFISSSLHSGGTSTVKQMSISFVLEFYGNKINFATIC